MHIRCTFAFAVLSLFSGPIQAAPGQQNLTGFRIGPKIPSDGELLLHTDGNFYGTTTEGGATGAGTIFRLTPEGAIDWFSLSEGRGSAPGKNPQAGMIHSSDGWMWGTASQGGVAAANGFGGIFRYRPENNEHQLVVGFENNGSSPLLGKNPAEGLSPDGTGWLWGAAPGGAGDNGVVYKVNEGSGAFEVVIGTTVRPWTNGSGLVKGRGPTTVYAHPGSNYVWGLTAAGGATGGNTGGTVFRIDRSTIPHAFITVGEFSRDSNAAAPLAHACGPTGRLTPDGLGFLWGASSDSLNISPSPTFGSLFKVDMTGTTTAATTVPLRFTGAAGAIPGDDPLGSLVRDTNGLFWGVTRRGGAGDKGTIFAFNPATNTMSTHIQVGSLTGANSAISNPVNPLTNDGQGHVWGLAQAPGNTGPWTFYKVAIATGSVTLVATYPAAELTPEGKKPMAGLIGKPLSPWLYGTTSEGGKFGFGTLYRYNTGTHALETLVHFTGTSGVAMGALAQAKLHIHSDGTVWGVTRYGGTGNFGTVFKYDPQTATFTHVGSFSSGSGAASTRGAQPLCKLVTGADGFIWGTTSIGFDGSIFKVNPATNVMTVVKTFVGSNNADGSQPQGGLAADSSGMLWGMTSRGGGLAGSATGHGTIFKIDPLTGTFTSVVKFSGDSGANPGSAPTGDPVFDSSGLLWGRTSSGTSIGVFKFNPATSAVTYVPDAAPSPYPVQWLSSRLNYIHDDGITYGVFDNGGTYLDGFAAGGGFIYCEVEGLPNASATGPVEAYPTIVTLSGGANFNGSSGSHQFEWGSTSALGQTTPAVAVTAGTNIGFTANLSLTGRTGYYFRTRVNTAAGTVYSPITHFVTRQLNPSPDPEITVESPIGLPLVDNITVVKLGRLMVGESAKQGVVVRSIGQSGLTGLTATISGPDASRFVITKPLSSTSLGGLVESAPTAYLFITYTPGAEGTHNALLTITSNDNDEASFEVPLTGTGVVDPDIQVEQPADTVLASDGSSTVNFGSSAVGAAAGNVTLLVKNVGLGTLNSVSVSLTGPNASDFSLPTVPGTSIPSNGSGNLVVGFTPSGNGTRTATLVITSSDPDEGTYQIALTGQGLGAPEIVVERWDSVGVNAGEGVPFGTVIQGESLTRRFTVRNTGTGPLTVSVQIVGQPQYQITASPSGTVAAGGSTTFDVTLTPLSPLPVIATMRLTTNDSDEGTFDIILNGFGSVHPNPVFPPSGQPQSRVVVVGQPTSFSPVVTGNDPKNFQWKKNGGNIAGPAAKEPTYFIASVKAGDAGTYNVEVQNDTPPAATSPGIHLGAVTALPGTLALKEGAVLTLTTTATAPPGFAIGYSWTRNNVSLPGQTGKALKITGVAEDDAGTYACTVTMTPASGSPFSGSTGNCAVTVLTKPVLSAIATPAPMLVSESINIDPLTTIGGVPATFAAKGLPAGVKLDPNTGVFSGKPTVAKSYSILFTATNAAGTSTPVPVTWIVESLADEGLVGTFNGLVERDSFTNFDLGGVVQLTTATTGVVSGSITLAGTKYSVTGVLDTSSGDDTSATLVAKRTPALGNLTVDLTIENNANRMTGTIRDPQFDLVESERVAGTGLAGSANGSLETASFNSPRGILVIPGHGGYVSDTGNHVIRSIGENDSVTTLAGTAGTSGNANGTGTDATFNGPEGLARDSSGNLYVADTGNRLIRKITPAGVVTTFAGSGVDGSANGTGTAASFSAPCALAFDPTGNLVVVDRGNHTLRKITPAGVVTILAGKPGVSGHKDGGGAAALFNAPRGITFDSVLKAFFVADTNNRVIRKVTPAGAVSTYAGSPGISEASDGVLANARFVEPVAIVSNGAGTLFVADTLLVQITSGGIIGTVTEYLDDQNFADHPVALSYDAAEQVVIAADDVLHSLFTHKGAEPSAGASFTAYRNIWTSTSGPAPAIVANYTAGMQTSQTGSEFPLGDGYATLAISKTGAAKWAGKTGDGTAFTFSTVLSPGKQVMLHAMLYKNTGSLQGIAAINEATGDLDSVESSEAPVFDWYKLSQPLVSKDRLYKAGFYPHPLSLIGGKYAPANNLHSFLDATSGAPEIVISSLASPFDVPLTITAPNKVVVPTTNGMKLSIAAATGLYTGSFTEGTPARKATIAGVLVNNMAGNIRRGYGHFTLPTTPVVTSPITSGKARIEKPD